MSGNGAKPWPGEKQDTPRKRENFPMNSLERYEQDLIDALAHRYELAVPGHRNDANPAQLARMRAWWLNWCAETIPVWRPRQAQMAGQVDVRKLTDGGPLRALGDAMAPRLRMAHSRSDQRMAKLRREQ